MTERGRPGWSLILGIGLGLLGLFFVVRSMAQDWDAVVSAFDGLSPVWVAVAATTGLAGMTQIGLAWRRLLSLNGSEVAIRDGLFAYSVGQLAKYVPGGIWPVLGRSEMGVRVGASRGAAYLATVGSLVLTYAAAIVLPLMLLPLTGGLDGRWVAAAAAVAVVVVAGLHPVVLTWMSSLASRLARRPVDLGLGSWGTAVGLFARHLPVWLAIGLATFAVARPLDGGADPWNVVGAASIAWFVGFVAVPVPGGIGVREAVFVTLATSMDPATAAACALTTRIVFVLVDLSGAGFWTVYRTIRARSAEDGDLRS